MGGDSPPACPRVPVGRGILDAPPTHSTLAFFDVGADTPGWPLLPLWGNSPSVLIGPYILFRGYFAAPAATHFANGDKVGKTPFKGEMFRFISPLKIPLFTDQSRPRKLQITRLARKGKTRSFRYSSSPNGNRLCWISIGLPFRPPYWMYPPGTGDGEKKRNHVGRGIPDAPPLCGVMP